jgi:hypothetical protein
MAKKHLADEIAATACSLMFRSAPLLDSSKNVLPPSCQLTASVMGKKGDQDDDRDRHSK